MNETYCFPHELDLSGRVERKSEQSIAWGSFGAVYKGSLDGTIAVAIKVLLVHVANDPKAPQRLAREMQTWSRTEHKNIQPLLGYCEELFTPARCFVSPWMENGTARNFIKQRPRTNRITLLKGIADGLTYLHKNAIIHGDIRGDNILIGPDGEPLINDFGLSRYEGGAAASSSPHGALRWMPPEWIAPETFKLTIKETHAFPLDVWSFGMTILELMTEQNPYAEYHSFVALSNAISLGTPPQRPEIFGNDEMWDLCIRIWNKAREERPQMHVIFGEITKLEHAPAFLERKMPKLSDYERKGKMLQQIQNELFKGISLLDANANLSKDRSAQRELYNEWERINASRLELVYAKQSSFGISFSKNQEKRALLGEAQKFYNDVKDFVSSMSRVEPLGQPSHSQQH